MVLSVSVMFETHGFVRSNTNSNAFPTPKPVFANAFIKPCCFGIVSTTAATPIYAVIVSAHGTTLLCI